MMVKIRKKQIYYGFTIFSGFKIDVIGSMKDTYGYFLLFRSPLDDGKECWILATDCLYED